MPYFFKFDDVLTNDDAYDIFLFALIDIAEGCYEVKGDSKIQVIVFNLQDVQVVKATTIFEHKNKFEYYAHHVGNEHIVESESFEYTEDEFDDFEEELKMYFQEIKDVYVNVSNLYVHVTCSSNMDSINARGLLTETAIPLKFKIGDREEEYTQSRKRSRSSSNSSRSNSSSSSSSSRSKKRRRTNSTGGKRKSRRTRKYRK